MDVTDPSTSPRGAQFVPGLPLVESENSINPFPQDLSAEFKTHLRETHNRRDFLQDVKGVNLL